MDHDGSALSKYFKEMCFAYRRQDFNFMQV